jgi:capsular exopolysaccharide synthesis family protein
MDSFDSYRSSVPARLPANRSGSPSLRASSGLPEATSHSTLSIRTVLRGARRYWWLVLMLWVVASAGIGAGIYLKVKPSFKAYSILRAEPPSSTLYGVNTSSETFEMFLQTQVQLITSPNVLTAAGTNPQAASLVRIKTAGDVVQELKKCVAVHVSDGTTLIEVSMTSPDSYESAVIVNAVVKAFLETNEEWADGMTRTQIKKLEEYLRELHNQTDELERRWKEFVARGDVDSRQLANDKRNKDNANTEDASSTRSVTIDQYKKVNNDILEIDMQLAEAQAVLATAKAAAGKINSSSSSPAEEKEQIDQMFLRQAQSDPDILAIAADMEKAEKRLDDALRIVRDESDPSVKRAKNAVDGFKVKYQKLWDSKYANFRTEREQGGSAAMTPEQEVRELSAKVDTLNARRVALNQKKQELNVDNQRQSTDMVDVMLIQDQRASIKLMQEQVQRRLEQLRYESRGETRVRKVSDATASPKPISDKRITYLAITPIGVLGTVLGLIVLLEIRSGRVADPDVLSSRVKHEVFSIAPLPNLKPGEDVNGEKAEQRLARFVQSLDHLRVAICEGGPTGGEGRCVMITSATGGEGKTTLSAHLAARCANSGTSTLLIDADMRRASLGRLLDVPVGAGLGDVLGGDIDLDEALITVQAGGFHFLSAGTPGRDPSRVLKSARLSDLIARLRQTYDLVIIDTPPVLPVADALILGRWADGAVMAARFDASRLPLVERANRQLALAGIPVLGVVVNGVRGQDAAYGNYAYSYNYYPSRSERSNGNPTV